jgi:serine/threonine protein kinase
VARGILYNNILKMNNKYNKTLRGGKTLKGGKVIGHGGFGCTFHPNLECMLVENGKTRKMKQTNRYVSKLMHNSRYFENEYSDVGNLDKYLSQIPNYERYFLYRVRKCKPVKITETDLKNFKECHKINKLPMKEVLKFDSLLLKYGGISVYDFVERNHKMKSIMKSTYRLLLQLFEKAIVPMNLLHVYHCDLKLDNLLYNKHNIKIIDFGFVSFFNPTRDFDVPYKFETFPWQFNMPVTVVLFDPHIISLISQKLHNNSTLLQIGKEIVEYCVNNGRRGHFNSLTELFNECKSKHIKDTFETFLAKTFGAVIDKFLNNDIFDAYLYFSTFYANNVDIIGFMTCVYDFARYSVNDKKKLKKLYYKIAFDCFFVKIDQQRVLFEVEKLQLFL